MDLKDKLTVPNCITATRILGSVCLAFTPNFSTEFFVAYTFCGITDVLDGFVARVTKKTSEFGAKLDSVSDLIFYTIMIVKMLPELSGWLGSMLWWMIGALVALRGLSYSIAAIKYRRFSSLHTYMNKLTGFAAFIMPYIIRLNPVLVGTIVWIIAMVAGVEETIIHLCTSTYKMNNKSAVKAVKGRDND